MISLGSKNSFPRARTRRTSNTLTTTSSLLLAGMISFYLYRRFHSSSSIARDEIFFDVSENDAWKAESYLRHHAKVKNWPRLEECADVISVLAGNR